MLKPFRATPKQTAERAVAYSRVSLALFGEASLSRLHLGGQGLFHATAPFDRPGPFALAVQLTPSDRVPPFFRRDWPHALWTLPGTENYTAADLRAAAQEAGRLLGILKAAPPDGRGRIMDRCYKLALAEGFVPWLLLHLGAVEDLTLASPQQWHGLRRQWSRGWSARPQPPALA